MASVPKLDLARIGIKANPQAGKAKFSHTLTSGEWAVRSRPSKPVQQAPRPRPTRGATATVVASAPQPRMAPKVSSTRVLPIKKHKAPAPAPVPRGPQTVLPMQKKYKAPPPPKPMGPQVVLPLPKHKAPVRKPPSWRQHSTRHDRATTIVGGRPRGIIAGRDKDVKGPATKYKSGRPGVVTTTNRVAMTHHAQAHGRRVTSARKKSVVDSGAPNAMRLGMHCK